MRYLNQVIFFGTIEYLSYTYILNYFIMTSKNPKPAYQFPFALMILILLAVVSCNNKKEEKKDVTTDTTVVKPSDPVVMPVDTTKMDTATTRPVKTPD